MVLLTKSSKASNEECGKRKGFIETSFGGQNTRKNEWPWLVALFYRETEVFFCGGSLLSRKHVMSGQFNHS